MTYAFDLPTGREVHPDPPTWAWGVDFMTATDEALAICRDAGFRELTQDEIDFERTNRKKFFIKGEGYFRYHQGSLECATDAGVSAFFVLSPGYLVLLARRRAGALRYSSSGTHSARIAQRSVTSPVYSNDVTRSVSMSYVYEAVP